MRQRFDTILIVDREGGARIEGPVAVPAGRHHVTVLVDDAVSHAAETWDAFIERTFGSLAESDLTRPPQGHYEQRDEIA